VRRQRDRNRRRLLGRIAGISWLRSGVQTTLVALVTVVLIYLIAGN